MTVSGFRAALDLDTYPLVTSFVHCRHISFLALVALKLLVSLIGRLVACSARIVADKKNTDRHTERLLQPSLRMRTEG